MKGRGRYLLSHDDHAALCAAASTGMVALWQWGEVQWACMHALACMHASLERFKSQAACFGGYTGVGKGAGVRLAPLSL